MTSDSFTTTEGATNGGSGGGGGNSYSQQNILPSPWAQVVRGGGEPDPVASCSPTASPSSVLTEQNHEFSDQLRVVDSQTVTTVETQPEGSESSSNGNATGVKKSAWNKPSANGVIETSSTPVMGAASWPALSELTRPLPKSLSFPLEQSSEPTSDGSVTVPQAPAILQQPQRPVRSNVNHHPNQSNANHHPTQSNANHHPNESNANHHPNQNNANDHPDQNNGHTVRQRSMRRGGGAGGGYNRFLPPPPPPVRPLYPLYDGPYHGFVQVVMNSPTREQPSYNGNNIASRAIGVGSHAHAVPDHSSNRRRNSFGPRPRGDGGPYPNNGHGGRRDHQDSDWRGPRSHAAIPPQMVPRPPPPPRGYPPEAHMGSASYVAPTHILPYGPPIGYGITTQYVHVPQLPPDPYRGALLPPRAAPPPMNPPANVVDTPLSVMILNQIEYYFSDANLVNDEFMRSYMDEEGWVPVTLIAGFRRVQRLTSDIPLILNCLRDSTIVEVKGEFLRRRNAWGRYLKPVGSTSQSSHAAREEETSMQNLSLDSSTAGETSTTDASNTHNDSSNVANGEVGSNDP